MPAFSDQVRTLVDQYKVASKTMRSTTTMKSSDPDIRDYEALTPTDFDEIAVKFGLTSAINLVEDMEARKLGVKRSASKA